MRTLLIAALLAIGWGVAPAHGETVLELSFDSPEQLEGTAGSRAPGYRGDSLLIARSDPEGSTVRRLRLPADRLAGKLITLSARVRAEEVSRPPRPWNGIKVMLVLETGEGRDYPQLNLRTGSFDWTLVQRPIRMPRAVTGAVLVLGLERVSGRAWFDEVRVETGRPVRGRPKERRFRGHDLPRLRGAMYGTATSEEDIRTLADWGANHIRLQINWVPMKKAEEWARDLDAFDRWLEGVLPEIDRGIDLCERYGLRVALDLHTPPGGRREGGVCRLFEDPEAREKLVEVWRRLAKRYKGRDTIWAYDILNEPAEPPPGPGVVGWPEVFTGVVAEIRRIEPGKPVIYEPGPWGGCRGFDSIAPLELDRVIYSFHMYRPHRFTHQGVRDNPVGVYYPGLVGGEAWDKDRLREAMAPAIDFQRDYNVHIYVGEFSAARWAPAGSAHRYLRDCIDIFEEQGWDWAYHAYREWQGWSVEHGPDPNNTEPVERPTRRKKLLLRWFARNERPARGVQTP